MSNTVYRTAFAANHDVHKTWYMALHFRLCIYKNASASGGLPSLRPLVDPQFNLLDPPLHFHCMTSSTSCGENFCEILITTLGLLHGDGFSHFSYCTCAEKNVYLLLKCDELFGDTSHFASFFGLILFKCSSATFAERRCRSVPWFPTIPVRHS